MSGSMEVVRVIAPVATTEGAGVRLRRGFPTRAMDDLDPFLLFDDFSSGEPEDYHRGFPWHPHRGIETVTYVLEGAVHHRDSLGNSGSIGAGDVQWMTSGSGIMHEEMPDPDSARMVGFQLWVNLPARLKMTTPRYQDFGAGAVPRVRPADGVEIRVVAGELDGVRGPVVQPAVAPLYLDVAMAPGGSIAHSIEPGHNAFSYIFAGEATFGPATGGGGSSVAAPALAVLGPGGHLAVRAARGAVRYLLVAGRPLGEPIARHGPFVMNTRAEIEEALRDLELGTFIRESPAGAAGHVPGRAPGF